ncbi:hypothetical protein LWC34_20165 [Kibdelosporangium philippinense]|uniref:Oxidoreductase n=1 Tax=Kibdelosporangium philippinense TaxID=211113 RepID=A0ABS8ZD26_9PSEU|nr:hypothetical protein [Kibdelosporangium philippinense]MCE7005124.1 hypothetical protein [Kibdelosporangium philippinense]
MSRYELTEPEQHLVEAFRLGDRIDLGGKQIRGPVLAELLDGSETPSVLRLSGAHITGYFSLQGKQVRQVIDLRDCTFEHRPDLRMARIVGLRMHACRMPGVIGRNLRVESDLILEPRFTCDGALDLTDASIDGSLRMSGAVLHGPFLGARLRISGSLQAVVLRTNGEMRLSGAKVGGNLQLTGARLTNTDGIALDGSSMTVEGNLLANAKGGRFRSSGRVLFRGARISADVKFTGAELSAPKGRSPLDADRIEVQGNVYLDNGLTADGPVRLADARIGGFLKLSGATLGNAEDSSDPYRAPYALFADGIELGGDLNARSGEIAGAPNVKPLVAYGQVRFPGAKIDGSASLSGAQLHCAGRDALFADRLNVGETLFLEGMLATGCIRLQDSKIGASLNVTGSSFTEPRLRADASRKPSLDLQFASIGHNLLCSRNVVATGGISARLADIRHTVHLSYAALGDGQSDSVAFDGYGMTAHHLYMHYEPDEPPQGAVRLGNARVRKLSDGPGLWRSVGGLDVDDFVYESIESNGNATVKDRLKWLRQVQPDFAPGPYDHLVTVYRDAGEEELAEQVLMEKQRRRHSELTWPGRIWGVLQDKTVGFGYRPWLAVVWLAVFWVAGTVWFSFTELSKLDNDQNPVWSPALLSLDLLLPIIDLGQDKMWRMAGPSEWVSGILIAAGWVLATTVAAGATRLLKRT